MADSITIFREPGTRYYSAVVDGRIIESLGPDEMLAALACIILPTPPPYATPRSLQEIRDMERERAERQFQSTNPETRA